MARKKRRRSRRNWTSMVSMGDHANDMLRHRNIQMDAVEAAMQYGRVHPRPGSALVYAIGRREIDEAKRDGIDISRHNGVQVVVTTKGLKPSVITVYRNRDLKSLHGRRAYQQDRNS